jgi:hypothetical protein
MHNEHIFYRLTTTQEYSRVMQMHTRTSIRANVHMCMYVHVCMCVHTYEFYVFLCMSICIPVLMFLMSVCMYVCIYT